MLLTYLLTSLGFVFFAHHCKVDGFKKVALNKRIIDNSDICCCCQNKLLEKQNTCDCGRTCTIEVESEIGYSSNNLIELDLYINSIIKFDKEPELSSNCCTIKEINSGINGSHIKPQSDIKLSITVIKLFVKCLLCLIPEAKIQLFFENILTDILDPMKSLVSHLYFSSNLRDAHQNSMLRFI